MKRETSASVAGANAERIAGRYTVEAQLAVGGVGAVYRVRDDASGEVIALKRLLPNVRRISEVMFRKEYHTLALLRHPRILQVYEYGLDAGRPYFTMELLDGDDLRALAPMPARDACRYLRDVASSLALLHAHRLVHRDLTPRNVRATSDGRCKLIDFGALAPFGVQPVLVGTAPFIAPEAIRGLPLDARSDLFSLGALAYYVLSRTHAYPARTLGELEEVWRSSPPPPSQRLSERDLEASDAVPEALDRLVLSLLSLDSLARPSSAAEVIEQLDAIGGLEPESGPSAAESYILSAQLVGRDQELARAEQLVTRAKRGKGSVLLFEHSFGGGGTRLLSEIGIEARLLGAVTLRVDGEVQRGPYATVRALKEQLAAMRGGPEELAELESLERNLRSSHWSSGDEPSVLDVSAGVGVSRARLQAALERFFLETSRTEPVALLIDNVQRVDEGSAALLAALAAAAREHRLVIVATVRTDERVSAPAAVQQLIDAGERHSLEPLSEENTRELVRSLFGDAPNSERTASWLFRRSRGHPSHVMELARHLVSHGIARYMDGVWVLPRELPATVPDGVEEALDVRIAELGSDALRLAETFSIHDRPLSIELCVAVAEAQHIAPFAALDELTSKGVLVGYGYSYRFAQGALRERLLARLGDDELKRLHGILGERLLEESDPDLSVTLEAGWHLLRAGKERKGAEILRRIGLELVRTDELPEAVAALEAAVGVYRTLDPPRHQLVGLLHPLAFAGYYVDRRLADRYGDEALQLLSEETGLALTARLRPYLGRHLSLVAGLATAAVKHCFGGRGGLRGLSSQIAILGGICNALTGTATLCLDRETAARRAAFFAPFRVLGLWHAGAFCHAFAETLVMLTEDRAADTIERLQVLLDRFDAPSGVIGFPERMKPITKGGLLYALGVLEGFLDGSRALERAEQLEACGLQLYDMVACQVRANYYACRGEIERAREYDAKVETFAVRNGSAWQAEIWASSSRVAVYSLTGDIIGLKRSAEELDRLSQEVPSLVRYARYARAALLTRRGEHEPAIRMLRALLSEVAPRGFIGWALVSSILARCYNETGRHEEARSLCLAVMEQLDERDRWVVTMNLSIEIQLALAEAGLGYVGTAAHRLDALLAMHAPGRGPLTLGLLHQARAHVALGADERTTFVCHVREMEHWFRATGNSSLVTQGESMVTSLRPSRESGPVSGEEPVTVRHAGSDPRDVITACHDPQERARLALELALEKLATPTGYLFGVRDGGIELLASNVQQPPSRELSEAVQRRIAEQFERGGEGTTRHRPRPGSYSIVLLMVQPEGRDVSGVGALVLPRADIATSPALRQFMRGLAEALYACGDVVAATPSGATG